MKSAVKTITKAISLTIIFSCFIVGVFAQNKFSGYLATSSQTSKTKIDFKIKDSNNTKLAVCFNTEKADDYQEIENWMLDSEFWEIEYTIEQEPVEKEMKVEEWMKNFNIDLCTGIDIYYDFIEKDWMKYHSFYIL
ncbi:MAG: hypothetical protein KOO66_08030 [Bacteroidales bacterium]|nr:hypothetical protein [Bacteroidales bacterium]